MQFELEQGVAVLRRTPAVLAALLRGLPESWIRSDEGSGTFSPFDVLGHLIHGERTDWIPRARIILEHGTRREFEPFDRFAHFEVNRGKMLDELLDALLRLREANLTTLEQLELTPEQLRRQGLHPTLGVVTLRQLLSTWVAHDLTHIVQVCRVMAKQYRDEVGPWLGYLSVLAPRATRAEEG